MLHKFLVKTQVYTAKRIWDRFLWSQNLDDQFFADLCALYKLWNWICSFSSAIKNNFTFMTGTKHVNGQRIIINFLLNWRNCILLAVIILLPLRNFFIPLWIIVDLLPKASVSIFHGAVWHFRFRFMSIMFGLVELLEIWCAFWKVAIWFQQVLTFFQFKLKRVTWNLINNESWWDIDFLCLVL